MPATVVVGTQWGDEGKGKFTDLVAKEMHMVVRYQGGHNAGHTLVVARSRPCQGRDLHGRGRAGRVGHARGPDQTPARPLSGWGRVLEEDGQRRHGRTHTAHDGDRQAGPTIDGQVYCVVD